MGTCAICGAPTRQGVMPWLLRCRRCRFQQSTLAQRIGSVEAHDALDERARADALGPLRARNFRAVLDLLERIRGGRRTLLDVGCAHGWFLRAAADAGWQATGIEPDARVAAVALAAAHDVRVGTFPEILREGERFDVVTFHDAFEHLADVNAALESVRRHLTADGILLINLPDARGIFYRLAHALARIGVTGPLARLWQRDFPSPHLSYFTGPLLRRLAANHHFRSLCSAQLPAVAARGLWSRLRYDRSAGLPASALAFVATCALLPALRALPSDISVEVFQLRSDSAAEEADAPRSEP
ncbi:MAG TPA: class I SAM-dependent methyltransferase [Myxococcales bacterium]|nr:class I SAM-dependent methyltransferase [Myxococcales bacterium]